MIRRRDDFDRDPAEFTAHGAAKNQALRRKITAARSRLAASPCRTAVLERAAELCMALGTDGIRGELTLIRAARALAAIEGAAAVGDDHLRRVAPPSLRHRLRRNPLDDTGATVRVERAIAEVFAA